MTNASQLMMKKTTPSAVVAKKYVGSGVILTRLNTEGGPRFLLLLGQETGVWSFPKGHPEPRDRDSPLRTAVRETYEETGYIAGQHYQILGDSLRFGKRPYWIGRMNEDGPIPPPRLCAAEHSVAGWFTISEIEGLNANTDVRAWLKKAALSTSGFARTLLAMPSIAPTSSSAPVCNVS
jgi:8-oxo-dGTP pyrophosphatase MutT (NUDIX family)